VLVRRDGRARLAAVLEAQLHVDPDKAFRWPVYAATARSRHRCDAIVVVLCIDEAVARWAGRPIRIGPGNEHRCVVLGPAEIPKVLDASEARGVPELAVLSALAHASSEDALRIASVALDTFGALDADRARLYYDLICAALPEAARRALENAMMKVDLDKLDTPAVRFWMDKGREEGRERGLAEGIFRVLEARGLAVPEDARVKVMSCTEASTLERSNGGLPARLSPRPSKTSLPSFRGTRREPTSCHPESRPGARRTTR